MSIWIHWCEDILWQMLDRQTGKFPYSTSLDAHNQYRHHFDHPLAIRYTVNTYLGLFKAHALLQRKWDLEKHFFQFLNSSRIDNPGDQGLLLLLFSENYPTKAIEWFPTIAKEAENAVALAQRPVQELCWLLWGLTRFVEKTGNEQGQELAVRVWKLIHNDFFDRDSLFPIHQHQWYRRRFVSFGAITYFLRSWFEYARVFSDRYAQVVAEELTRRIIAQQGPRGEWGWFYDVYRGELVEWYPIFSVHQDAMAMLFLFPALDAGIEEAKVAISKSMEWLIGNNELGRTMLSAAPPLIYRSIRRKERPEQLLRLLRAWGNALLRRPARFAPPTAVEINPECRSYHLGWILYIWSDKLKFLSPKLEQRIRELSGEPVEETEWNR